ncbi:MAG: peptide transporter ATP-binding protein [Alphaproteobacteria bacterium]|nr:peptide transporter ATP-binding protein [Alphaproteobacteria bacterium]
MIRVENIVKNFEGRNVLNGVSMTMEQGKITCLIGPSGSGKTTLLRTLTLLEPADSGQLYIEGVKYDFPLDGPLRVPPWPGITVVFQSLFLWPHLTMRENIMLPARRAGLPNVHERLEEIVAFFEMAPFIDRYPNEASRGQQQRVALARALMLNPKYVFLDEITSALDVEQVAKVLEYLQKLRDTGIGIFIITHLLGFARRASDQILFLNDGKIEESGGPEILVNPQSVRLKNFVQLIEAAS